MSKNGRMRNDTPTFWQTRAMDDPASIEVERKFRVRDDPLGWAEQAGFDLLAAWEIWQGYLSPPRAPNELRIRRIRALDPDTLRSFEPVPLPDVEDRRVLGLKQTVPTSHDGGLSRREIEEDVSEPFFAVSWDACVGRRLHKRRLDFMVDLPGEGRRVVVVDLFRDRLEGLVLAEVEFGAWEASTRFEPPGFLGDEVTHDTRYRNANLVEAQSPPA